MAEVGQQAVGNIDRGIGHANQRQACGKAWRRPVEPEAQGVQDGGG
jgi:hypothetical protein